MRQNLPKLGDTTVDARAKDDEDDNARLKMELNCADAMFDSISNGARD